MNFYIIIISLTFFLTGCRTSDSTVKVGRGENLKIKGANDSYKLEENGDLYCHVYASERNGEKIASNINWFDIDKWNNVWALSKKGKVYQINLGMSCYSRFVRTEKTSHAVSLVTSRGNTRVQAVVLRDDDELELFTFSGHPIEHRMYDVIAIGSGCSHTHKKGSEFAAFALTADHEVLGIYSDGSYRRQEGEWRSIGNWKKKRKICK